MKASGSTTSNTIAVILTIAVLVLAWKMVLPGYFSHKTNLDSITSEIDAAKIKLDSIEKSKAELSAIKPITDQLLAAVPKGADEPDLISELEAIAVKNGIVLPSISITQEEGSQTTTTTTTAATPAATGTITTSPTGAEQATASAGKPLTIAFSVDGNFENLNNFITGLEKSVRFMDITGLTYSLGSEGKGYTLALQIEAFQR